MQPTIDPSRVPSPAPRCIVCGGTSDDVVMRDNGYEGRACACGTIYTSPTPPPTTIDPTAVVHEDEFYDLPAALKARWVRRWAGGESLLEVGCGTGRFLEEAKRVGYTVQGIEPVESRAAQAEARTGGIVHRCVLEEFTPGGASLDVVYHCDMLAHFPDPGDALRRMTALLAPRGVLAFEVGLIGGVSRFWYPYVSPSYPAHLWFYSERSLQQLLRQNGLRMRHATRFDLSMCMATALLLRQAVALRRAVARRRRRAAAAAGDSGPAPTTTPRRLSLHERESYHRFQNFLRYRAGAVLPRLGPGTLLVVAERL